MTKKSGSPLLISLILGLLLLFAPGQGTAAALVCTTSWANAAGGSWDTGGNRTAGVPVASSDVCIDLAGTYTVTLIGAKSVNSVTLGNVSGVQTLLIRGSNAGGNAKLTSATGITNVGTITLDTIDSTWSSTLKVTTGALANRLGGVINVNQGAGGARTITANLTNDGTVNLNQSTTFNGGTRTYANNAAFNIAATKTLTISGGSNTFTQTAGTLDIDGVLNWTGISGSFNMNGGTLDLSVGSCTKKGGSFDYIGGVILGNPTLSLTKVNLTLGAGGVSPAIFRMRGTSTLTGNNLAGQALLIQGSSAGGNARLTSATGFTNFGSIILDTIDSTWSSTLKVTTGTPTNPVGRVINIDQGAGGARTPQPGVG